MEFAIEKDKDAGLQSLPLARAQAGAWLDRQVHDRGGLYNHGGYAEIEGALDVRALETSLRNAVARFAALRVRFDMSETPWQSVMETVAFDLPLIDCRSHADPRASALHWMRQDLDDNCEPTATPLFRFALLRLSDAHCCWYFRYHHIAVDALAAFTIAREVALEYSRLMGGSVQTPTAGDADLYRDYVTLDAAYADSTERARDAEYWRRQYRTTPERLPLSIKPAAVNRGRRHLRHSVVLDAGLNHALAAAARKWAIPVEHVLLGLVVLFLHCRTGRRDIAVGFPVGGRMGRRFQHLVGMFTNTLPLRFKIDPAARVEEFQRGVATQVWRGLIHQRYRHEDLRRDLGLVGESDFANVIVNVLPTAADSLRFGAAKAQVQALAAGHIDDMRILLYGENAAAERVVDIDGNPSMYADWELEATAVAFRSHVERVLSNPGQRIEEIDLLCAAERQRITRDWNATSTDYPRHTSVAELISRHAAVTPDANAIIHRGEVMTYRDLETQSNQMAHYLRRLGAGPEIIVGLCAARSIQSLVAVLGIWKAGAAYLPLDAAHPPQRLEHMLSSANAPLLITHSDYEEALPSHWARVIRLDEVWDDVTQCSIQPPAVEILPANPAYVIFTSGSTGQPKGVMVQHGGLNNLVHAQLRDFGVGAQDRVVQFASWGFDASIWETVMALCSGATLMLLPSQASADTDLGDYLFENKITVATLPPAVLPSMEGRKLPDLRLLIVAGEACKPQTARRWSFNRRFVNAYGPTESTVCATHANYLRGETVSIGRPLANFQIYVLDARLRPVPLGVVGTLFIAGEGLARGYVGSPGLTAQRFLANPFDDGERMYDTGDRVRFLTDGSLEFVGRVDHQVKIRGYRIELAEIESALLTHRDVQQAVVVAWERAPGDRQLVAYVVAEEAPEDRALQDHLRQRLPQYMIPALFVRLGEIKLNSSGKIDRRALPAPDELAAGAVAEPRTPVEAQLLALWQEMLGVERLGIHDNFFEKGGHSLLATRMLARVRELYKIDLQLRTLFDAPTVAEFGELIRVEQSRSVGGEVMPAIEPAPSGFQCLSFAQARLLFLEQLGVLGTTYTVPCALSLTGVLDAAVLADCFAELVRRHEILRTCFEYEEGEARPVIDAAGEFQLQFLDASGPSLERARAQSLEIQQCELARPFDLRSGPLFRVTLVKLAATEHALLITLHHLISDGWSQAILLRELGRLYRAKLQGEPVVLDELKVRYTDYALWQRQWLQGEVLEKHLAYWSERLAGAAQALELPTDRPRPAVASFKGAALELTIPRQVTEELRHLAQAEEATLFMVLLAAFQWLLSRLSGQQDIVVGTPIAGRTHRSVENVVGLFVNTLAIRTDVSGNPSFPQLLDTVKEAALGAFAHQELPFEKLIGQLQPQRDLSRQPLCQVIFALQNMPQVQLDLPDLQVRMLPIQDTTSKFDLSLSLIETAAGLQGYLEYATDLFDAATIERWTGHYQYLLEQIAAAPERQLCELDLLRAHEQEALLRQGGGATQAYPSRNCFHELVAQQALDHGEAIAVRDDEETLTYRQLDERANQLAHYLKRHGAGPEVIVGLCLARSVRLVVAVLGIFKSGAAYLGLDEGMPDQRLTQILKDAGAALLLTQERLAPRFAGCHTPQIHIDADWPKICELPPHALDSGVQPDNLAYVIYTSGSSGQPKGTLLQHRGLCNLAAAQRRAFDVDERSQVLQFARLSFDASIWEMVMALGAGACLHMVDGDGLAAGAALAHTLQVRRITHATLPPALLPLLQDHELLALKYLIVAGEACPAQSARAWRGRCHFINAYGPTETTVCATYGEYAGDDAVVGIGQALANLQVYVLDESLRMVPEGVAGELYVSGVALARGYLHRPGLTASRFIAHPYRAGERLYRTGDVVRFRAGGLEFVGRRDEQVKLRGHRIELGEIQSVLLSHASVQQAVARLWSGSQLVAYIESAATDPDSLADDLRRYLRERLPDYMIPSSITVLESLPLNSNGKLDASRLPAPRFNFGGNADSLPLTVAERQLAAIWCEVLAVESVGATVNFFDMGGHSLLMPRLLKLVNERLAADIKLTDLFKYPNIRQLAAVLDAAPEAATPAIVHGGARSKRSARLTTQRRRAHMSEQAASEV